MMADVKFWPIGCNKSELKLVKRLPEGSEPSRGGRSQGPTRQR